MKRAMPGILWVLLVAWGGWLVYQYVTESPTANRLFEQKIHELGQLPTDYLLRKTGDNRQVVQIKGRSYRIRWTLTARQDIEEAVEARVHVDYLDVLPFGDVKLGPAARFTITTTTGGQERAEFKRSF